MKSGKKNLLIINNNMTIGGAQHSLVNLLNEIKNHYDITLLLFYNHGEYKEYIPSDVKVMEASWFLKLLGASQKQAGQMGIAAYLLRGILALYTKIFSNHLPIRLLISTQKRLLGFDTAISFLHYANEKVLYGGCNEFVLNRVDAKQKVAFLHCDFSNHGGNTEKNKESYKNFDKIAMVSQGCRQNFISAIPELAGRTFCVYNCEDYDRIRSLGSYNPLEYKGGCINLVTVARLSKEKGILRGIGAVKRLLESGYKLEWHIIGDGMQWSEIRSAISGYGVTEYIHLYGNQKNPYRYMKNAHLFLLTSFHEAAPMVVNEAKCLGIPILATNTVSAREMILDGKEGFICENSEDGIFNILKSILDSPDMLGECREYLNKQKYSNEEALLQFHKLIDERV